MTGPWCRADTEWPLPLLTSFTFADHTVPDCYAGGTDR